MSCFGHGSFWLQSKAIAIIALIVGWDINVPYQHKNMLYGEGLGLRFSSARLRMANDIVTYRPYGLFVQRQPRMGKDREAHLSYYISAYNTMETNQPAQDL